MTDVAGRALERTAEIVGFEAGGAPIREGYVDLLGGEVPRATGVAQRLMGSSIVPVVYERWWRPALGRVAKGPRGPSMAEELRLARELLSIAPGETVIDFACGPGNLTRTFAEDAGSAGTVVGLDVSRTMLARAVRDTTAPQAVYVRGDITRLSLQPGSAEAVSCFAALHLFRSPDAALDAMASVLADDGRLAILTSARPRRRAAALAAATFGRLSGMEIFAPGTLARSLARRGLAVTYQQEFGLVQVLCARRRPNGTRA